MSEAILDQDLTQASNPVLEVISRGNPLWIMAADIEASVFIDSGYVAKASELAQEYEPYIPGTEFLTAVVDGETIGSVRCIRKTPTTGFKTLSDIAEGRLIASEAGQALIDSVDQDSILEIGTLAVAPEYRSRDDGRVSVHLYGAIHRYMENAGLTTIIASFDERYFNSFKAIFGDTVQQIGPAVDYMGSPTVPAIMNAHDMFEHLKTNIPEVYQVVADASKTLHINSN